MRKIIDYVAMGRCGTWYAYSNEPRNNGGCWCYEDGHFKLFKEQIIEVW